MCKSRHAHPTFLDEGEKARYTQLQQCASSHTLNTRLRELLEYNLIERKTLNSL